ncbi:type I-F CRISPR-associated endoribonuclease Cas6/Csy4 [Coxiella burnetii]|uniref:Hypothetical cytosolic protein n=1 Tax=Coxiella burnetii (strain Dugway 5J108-111) TaxID=434922 RepID=A9KCH6_COXBN|nr:type I-F CRISPR-associated endoribonuclease Cas6/Csy4 [Coxiella burnetii]ABS76551.1 hypothetical cytosolic protein [Coxiella burnetii Dugway 5J108-111]OYK80250.1 type I-F CRISPR-associated endoribonuclease Cas6/Csy4 [Coxiella burnetii]OYK82333.1 type I-F CRISPR-associated endoribonuclease Cas6/Csy4 [Coxiella burnetii]
MKHYLEIRLLPDPEFAPMTLMNALYAKLHRALVQLQSTDIGVSFPDYRLKEENFFKPQLGTRLRLHSTIDRLQELMNTNWLRGMHDHIRIGRIYEVPSQPQYAIFRRAQVKSNAERIRRRHMRRHKVDYQEALARIPDSVEKKLALPFLTFKSQSTEQMFRLYIKQEILEKPLPGDFNSYAISKAATVPLF